MIFYSFSFHIQIITYHLKMSSKPTSSGEEKQLTYYGNPSGREILTLRLEELIENYNQEAQRESELLERTKKEIHELAATIIKVAEENHLKRQEERHTKMSETMNNIQEVLTKLDEEEKEPEEEDAKRGREK